MYLFDERRLAALQSTADLSKTPLFYYDLDIVREKFREIRGVFPNIPVYYSLKANPNKEIVRRLTEDGCRLDVSSYGELERALSIGADPDRIAFTGPGKSHHELTSAVLKGVGRIVVESIAELQELELICGSATRTQTAVLRINPGRSTPGPYTGWPNLGERVTERMTGGPSKFGIEELELQNVPRDLHWVKIVGVHTYVSSQNLSLSELISNFEELLRLAKVVQGLLGLRRVAVQWGVGLGVKHSAEDLSVPLERLAHAVAVRIRNCERHFGVDLSLEMGRFLVAECGVFVARLIRLKNSHGRLIAILDGGFQQFLRLSIASRPHPVYLLRDPSGKRTMNYSLAGPACTPVDFLDNNAALPQLQVGDLLAFGNAGAYGASMSLTNFHNVGWPIEIVADSSPEQEPMHRAGC